MTIPPDQVELRGRGLPEALIAQSPFEIDRLVALFRELDPKRVLEIGVWHGGTLWHWLQADRAYPDRTVVAVDDAMLGADQWRQWAADTGVDLRLIQGHSHYHDTVEAVRKLGPYDFVFIDAEHTYEAVRGDWERYLPMVRPGGVVAFHDIKPRHGYGVSQLWEEIRSVAGARTCEFWQRAPYYADRAPAYEHGTNYDPGIGVVWL